MNVRLYFPVNFSGTSHWFWCYRHRIQRDTKMRTFHLQYRQHYLKSHHPARPPQLEPRSHVTMLHQSFQNTALLPLCQWILHILMSRQRYLTPVTGTWNYSWIAKFGQKQSFTDCSSLFMELHFLSNSCANNLDRLKIILHIIQKGWSADIMVLNKNPLSFYRSSSLRRIRRSFPLRNTLPMRIYSHMFLKPLTIPPVWILFHPKTTSFG